MSRDLREIFEATNVPRRVEYQAVGRRLLMVDELPQGAYARYEQDVRQTAHVINREGSMEGDFTIGDTHFNIEGDMEGDFTIDFWVKFKNKPIIDMIGFKPSASNKFKYPVPKNQKNIY
jgi:hypothetical protein